MLTDLKKMAPIVSALIAVLTLMGRLDALLLQHVSASLETVYATKEDVTQLNARLAEQKEILLQVLSRIPATQDVPNESFRHTERPR